MMAVPAQQRVTRNGRGIWLHGTFTDRMVWVAPEAARRAPGSGRGRLGLRPGEPRHRRLPEALFEAIPGWRPDLAVVAFEHHYSSNKLSSRTRKRQHWLNEGGCRRIVYEGVA